MERPQGPIGSAIQTVPAAEVRNVRASTALTSFWHAVEICVLNSVDAGATEVHIETDFSAAAFQVTDNGRGLDATDMRLLGQWNVTSKDASLGARGEGLAAICATAVVDVSSRAAGTFETHSCVLRAGQVLQCKLAAEQRTRPGTVIAVRDLFFNRPVARNAILGAGG
jgi:DNA mismatch repair ATPase MutL